MKHSSNVILYIKYLRKLDPITLNFQIYIFCKSNNFLDFKVLEGNYIYLCRKTYESFKIVINCTPISQNNMLCIEQTQVQYCLIYMLDANFFYQFLILKRRAQYFFYNNINIIARKIYDDDFV